MPDLCLSGCSRLGVKSLKYGWSLREEPKDKASKFGIRYSGFTVYLDLPNPTFVGSYYKPIYEFCRDPTKK